jgi:hypothetical protein
VSSHFSNLLPIRRQSRLPGHVPAGGWIVPAALFALCLLPRAIMAWKLPGICPDAVLYIRMGNAFEAGLLEQALGNIRFNVYPLILAALHRAGLGWEMAGAVWGVVISSCTVLPLFGWIRRVFDRRTALGAGFLYAVHPGLIRWSVEVIRDPTFWFLLAASVYLLWLAITELRWRWFLASGVTIALACLTRFEGLALFALLAAWSVWRARQGARSTEQGARSEEYGAEPSYSSLPAPRPLRLLAGGLMCAAMYPLSLLYVNCLWYHGSVTGLVRTEPAELARDWAQESVSGRPEAKTIARPDLLPLLPWWKMAERYVTGLFKGLSPLFLLALGVGIATERSMLRRPDYRAMLVVAVPILLAVWVHLYWSHEAGPRYFFPLVMLAAPLASRGLWQLASIARQVKILPGRLAIRPTFALPTVILVANMFIAFSGDTRSRAEAVEVGQWVRQSYGPAARIFGPDGFTQVVAYYAQARCVSYPERATTAAVVRRISRWRPAVVLLAADGPDSPRDEILMRIKDLGFEPIDERRLSRAGRQIHQQIQVMIRPIASEPLETTDRKTAGPGTDNDNLKTANCKLQI